MLSFAQKFSASSKSSRSVFLGFVLLFLVVVLFCHHFQVLAHMSTQTASDCVFLANYLTSLRGGDSISYMYLGLLVLLVALAVIAKASRAQTGAQSAIFHSWNSSLIKSNQHVAKLYNPLFEALRKGILHTQIYNIAVFAN